MVKGLGRQGPGGAGVTASKTYERLKYVCRRGGNTADLFGKYKSPQDFVISAFRAFDRVPDDGQFIVSALDMMGQAPYRPGSPAGWPDTAEHWGGADALYKRIEWSNAVARHAGTRVNPLELANAVLGPALGDHTRTAISRVESVMQGTTLLLASPEFQRR